MVKVADSRVQGTKASFQLASTDDQVWWVDTTTAAGAIMHRILFDKNAQANGMAPDSTAMDPIVGKGAGAGAKSGHTDIPDTRTKFKALSAKGHAKLEDFIAGADTSYWTDQTGRSVWQPQFTPCNMGSHCNKPCLH